VTTNISEVHVECHEDSVFRRCGREQSIVIGTDELFIAGECDIMACLAQRRRD
jgi:hypothetical protein